MNLVKYLFEGKEESDDNLILGREKNWTYRDIYSKILKIAKKLEGTENKKIVLFAVNSAFWISSYFGILGSKNTCIPLDPKLSGKELSRLIVLIKPAMLISDSNLLSKFQEFDIPTLTEQDFEDLDEGTIKDADNDGLAAIIFTSGSSGEAKGSMISHGNIIANTRSIVKYLGLTKEDIIEVVLPFYYCYGASLLHTHVRVGGKIVLNNKFISPKTVIQDIKDFKCTGFSGVPSHFEILTKHTDFLEEDYPNLKYLTQAGGKMRDELIKKIHQAMKPKRVNLIIMYGQTEATARLSYLPYHELDRKLGSIGKGIPDVELNVVNNKGEPVKPGELGEVIARGNNIMLGYYEDADSTNEKIINGWMYTGDIGTVDEDGYIFLTGRKDNLVKVGGVRVNLEEVKSAFMNNIEEIAHCYVTSTFDSLLGSSVIALIALKTPITEEEIMNRARTFLTSYQLPKKILVVDKIPFTPSGKVAKKEIEKLIQNEGY